MGFAQDQIDELKALCAEVLMGEEGGTTIFILKGLGLPSGTEPSKVDALLWPSTREGYFNRLFYAQPVITKKGSINWALNGVVIADQKWWAFSWQTKEGLRLAQMVMAHLNFFRG